MLGNEVVPSRWQATQISLASLPSASNPNRREKIWPLRRMSSRCRTGGDSLLMLPPEIVSLRPVAGPAVPEPLRDDVIE